MNIADINPYIRYARCIALNKRTHFDETVPLDARLFYTLSGQGKIRVKDKTYEMPPHALLIINAGVPYIVETPDAPVEYIVLNFDYTQKAAEHCLPEAPVTKAHFAADMLLDYTTFEDAQQLSEVFYLPQMEAIYNPLLSILNEHTQKILYYENKTGHILAQCIFDCLRYWETGNLGIKKSSVSGMISYIHDNYRKNLTNAEIGRHFGYHPNYVSFVIKCMTGIPLRQYIIHVRLMRAADLLETGVYSIAEIAEQSGFCDVSYFSKCFKKHFGINPSDYRKRT